jgi:hypothetical protein
MFIVEIFDRFVMGTHYVSATKPNRLMLFGETVAVYCENHTEHTNTLCGQNAEYSGTSVVEHNSFLKAVRKPICLKTETIFPYELM